MTKTKYSRALVSALAAASLAPAIAAAQAAPALAPGVERAPDLKPVTTQYVVTNGTPIYRTPSYAPDQETGQALKRGEHPQILGEANMGGYLLVGRGGRGVGYVPRSLLCPTALCGDVKD